MIADQQVEGPGRRSQNSPIHKCTASFSAELPVGSKTIAELTAQLAIAAYVALNGANGNLLICAPGHSHCANNLAELQVYATPTGVAP